MKNQAKSNDLVEIRVMMEPKLAKKFHEEARLERRNLTQQLRVIFEDRYVQQLQKKEQTND